MKIIYFVSVAGSTSERELDNELPPASPTNVPLDSYLPVICQGMCRQCQSLRSAYEQATAARLWGGPLG